MSKRHSEEVGDADHINKRLKTLERMVMRSRRNRIRIIESSSSEASSREPSPSSRDQQGKDNPSIRTAPSSSSRRPSREVNEASQHAEETPTAAAASADAAAESAENTPSLAVDLTVEEDLDSALLDILGEDPSATIQYGPNIQKDLASRFEHLATNGLDKNIRKELTEKYLVPGNCVRVGAPILNAEIKAALPDTMVKRDKAIEARQKQLATAIAVLGTAMTDQMGRKDTDHELIKKLMDMARLLCDIQYAESVTRRNFAMYSLKKDLKEHLNTSKVDKYLFGESLPEALKTAKAVNKTGTELKVANKATRKPAPQNQKPQAGRGLNWRAPAPPRRPAGAGAPPRSREPAPAPTRNTRAAAYRQSSPPPRSSRRR